MIDLPYRYWILPDQTPATRDACTAAAAKVGHWLNTGRGAGADRDFLKVELGATAPDGVTDLSYADWSATQQTGPWVPFDAGCEWTLAEKAVRVPEAIATAAHAAHLPNGLSCCERLDNGDGTWDRLVRYTGTKPEHLSAFATLYAADVAALIGG